MIMYLYHIVYSRVVELIGLLEIRSIMWHTVHACVCPACAGCMQKQCNDDIGKL